MPQIQKIVETYKELRNDLFIRGFLITNDNAVHRDEFPFYGNWKEEKHNDFLFLTHPLTGKHFYEENGRTFFLMGHAYNPFTMETDETVILERIASGYGSDDFFEKINEITGVYVLGVVDNEKCEFLVDPSGMQSACYGVVNNKFYCSSHPQLIGDICNLQMDDFVKELVSYKWYGRVMGPYLPADLSPFAEVKRIVPGIHYKYDCKISHKRFWGLKPLKAVETKDDYNRVIKDAAEILKNNMELVSRKWNKPWISLTGGIDSNTTFAAANGIYDRFEAFSYISAPKEVPDTEAAKKIADAFDVKHHVFQIPADNSELEKFDAILEILRHNNGYVAEPPQNEARKRMYLRNNISCDVEVKSWVSETIRGYWYKYYGRKTMPKLSAKLFRNLYKIFIFNRPLAHKIDNLFAQYIKDFEYESISGIYPPRRHALQRCYLGQLGRIEYQRDEVLLRHHVYLQQSELFRPDVLCPSGKTDFRSAPLGYEKSPEQKTLRYEYPCSQSQRNEIPGIYAECDIHNKFNFTVLNKRPASLRDWRAA